MAMLKVRNPWVIVSQLIKSGEPEFEIREVEDFFSAIVVLLRRSAPSMLRAKALEILRDTNRRGKIVWGSIEPYVIFFYHLAFEVEFPEAAEELRKLIENSLKSSREDFPKFSHKLFELINKGYRYKCVSKDLQESKDVKKLIWNDVVKPTIYEETALLRLVADIIFYKITQLVPRSFDHDYRDVENEYDSINIPIDEEVRDAYLIPRSNSVSLVYEYFLRRARQIQIPDTYSIVSHKLREITSEIERRRKALRSNKFIAILGWIVTFTLLGLTFFTVIWTTIYLLGSILGSILGAALNIIITILLQIFGGNFTKKLESISRKTQEQIINLLLRKLLSEQRKLEEKLAGFFEF